MLVSAQIHSFIHVQSDARLQRRESECACARAKVLFAAKFALACSHAQLEVQRTPGCFCYLNFIVVVVV